MISCIFTLDYEVYGDGSGTLSDLVLTPADALKRLFDQYNVPFVLFVEAAEFQAIEAAGEDAAIGAVKAQVQAFYEQGIEIGLHMHPWWYRAARLNDRWALDYSRYNICDLPETLVAPMLDDLLCYLRTLVDDYRFVPIAHRAGHLLFDRCEVVAPLLASRGIKIDSSVYKGGFWQEQHLDYRGATKNGYFWTFRDSSVVPDTNGHLLEIPVHTRIVPTWTMLTRKRVGMQLVSKAQVKNGNGLVRKLRALAQTSRPLKLDFCQMTLAEMVRMVDAVIKEDAAKPAFRPIVAIGHSKDMRDLHTVESFVRYLKQQHIEISTFGTVYERCLKHLDANSTLAVNANRSGKHFSYEH